MAGGQWYWIHKPGATQAEINLFVDEPCLQYLHCTEDAHQTETIRLSAVGLDKCTTMAFYYLANGTKSFRLGLLPKSQHLAGPSLYSGVLLACPCCTGFVQATDCCGRSKRAACIVDIA